MFALDEVKDKKDENTLSNSFELGRLQEIDESPQQNPSIRRDCVTHLHIVTGEWASSQAALPLKGFEGLSHEAQQSPEFVATGRRTL